MPILRISMLNVSPRGVETVEYAALAGQHVKLRLAPDVFLGKVYDLIRQRKFLTQIIHKF